VSFEQYDESSRVKVCEKVCVSCFKFAGHKVANAPISGVGNIYKGLFTV
jgi:hypothetical protein